MTQTSSYLFAWTLPREKGGVIFKLSSFFVPDIILMNIAVRADEFLEASPGKWVVRPGTTTRTGVIIYNNAYTGFGSIVSFNSTYNYYAINMARDHRLSQYLILPLFGN